MSELEARIDFDPSGEIRIATGAATNIPPRLPLVITRGGDWLLKATWLDTGAVDLSSATAAFTIYDAPNGTPLVSLTQASGITLAATAPTITVALTASAINAYTWGPRAVYRLAVTLSGTTTVLLTGPVVLRGG